VCVLQSSCLLGNVPVGDGCVCGRVELPASVELVGAARPLLFSVPTPPPPPPPHPLPGRIL
jgi:hypothetical protein